MVNASSKVIKRMIVILCFAAGQRQADRQSRGGMQSDITALLRCQRGPDHTLQRGNVDRRFKMSARLRQFAHQPRQPSDTNTLRGRPGSKPPPPPGRTRAA